MALSAKTEALKKKGVDVISLSIGQPTWPTPPSIALAGKQAIDKGETKYTPASGSTALKESICTYTKKQLGLNVSPAEVTVSIGAKFVVFSALQALCDPGDEVLAPAPYWVSYPAMAELASAEFKPIPTRLSEGFKLGPEDLDKHISKKSKLLILNSPNNPTGAVFSLSELKALGEVLRAHPHIYILSDDIYNELSFSQAVAPHLLMACPDLQDRTLAVNAVSKNYSMPGWRLGWAVGPQNIISAMSKFQGQSVSCASSISQSAAVFALLHGQKETGKAREFLVKMRALALKEFQSIEGLNVFEPEGAFYLWLGVDKFFGRSCNKQKILSSLDFAESLLSAQAVACVPGEAFGCPGFIRIHFAVSEPVLLQAGRRIKDFTSALV